MKKSTFITAMCLIAFFCRAQMTTGLNKDSLQLLLARAAPDTNKVLLYITLGQQYETNKPDMAMHYYLQAGQLSRKLNYPRGILKYISNYTAILNVQGKLDESIRLNLEAIKISETHGLKNNAAKAYSNLGAVYQYQEDYPNAVKYYLKALPLLEQFSDLQSQAILMSNLCGVYRNMDQPDKAIAYARRALKISESLRDPYVEGNTYINLGNCFTDIKDYKQAEAYFKRAERLSLQIHDINMQETALINLGNIYLKLDQPERYIPMFYKTLPLVDSIQDVSGKAFVLLGIGEGLFRRRQWEKAEAHLYNAIAFARDNDQREVLQKLYRILSDTYIAMHRFDKARIFSALHDSVETSLVNASVLESVASMEGKYKLEQKQNELLSKDILLQRAQAQSTQQRYWLIGSVTGVVVLILLLFLFYQYYNQKQLLSRKTIESLEADKKSVRLQSLLEGQQQERIRISQEIHDDMGSALTSILFISRSLESTSSQSAQAVSKLSSLASKLIEKMNEIVWAMRGEPEQLEDFVLQLRSLTGEVLGNAGIDFDFHISGSIPAIVLPVEYRHHLYLIVKEAMHNIVKHANATHAVISLNFDRTWFIEVQDNGAGIPLLHETTGNGIRNMYKRASAIQGKFSIVQHHGTCVRLELPPVS